MLESINDQRWNGCWRGECWWVFPNISHFTNPQCVSGVHKLVCLCFVIISSSLTVRSVHSSGSVLEKGLANFCNCLFIILQEEKKPFLFNLYQGQSLCCLQNRDRVEIVFLLKHLHVVQVSTEVKMDNYLKTFWLCDRTIWIFIKASRFQLQGCNS